MLLRESVRTTGPDTHRRMENVSRANLIRIPLRDSLYIRPDRKSAINFLPVSWIKITKFKESRAVIIRFFCYLADKIRKKIGKIWNV